MLHFDNKWPAIAISVASDGGASICGLDGKPLALSFAINESRFVFDGATFVCALLNEDWTLLGGCFGNVFELVSVLGWGVDNDAFAAV